MENKSYLNVKNLCILINFKIIFILSCIYLHSYILSQMIYKLFQQQIFSDDTLLFQKIKDILSFIFPLTYPSLWTKYLVFQKYSLTDEVTYSLHKVFFTLLRHIERFINFIATLCRFYIEVCFKSLYTFNYHWH